MPTVAEEYAAMIAGGVLPPVPNNTATILLPKFKITATVRAPRSIELARAGLLPLSLTNIEPEKLDEDEYEAVLEKAEIAMKRLVCECSVAPRIVDREPKKNNQIKYSDVDSDDVTVLYSKIMELAISAYFDSEPATENKAALESLKLIAIHAKRWNLDPVKIGREDPAYFAELLMFSDLLDEAIKKAEGNG